MKRLAEGGDGSSVLTIDASVHDSYDGHLVQVKHHYKVEGKTGSCYTDPSVGVQVHIQPPTAGAGGMEGMNAIPFLKKDARKRGGGGGKGELLGGGALTPTAPSGSSLDICTLLSKVCADSCAQFMTLLFTHCLDTKGAGHPIASAPAAVTQQPGAFHQNTDWKPTKRESFSVPMDRAVHGGTYVRCTACVIVMSHSDES